MNQDDLHLFLSIAEIAGVFVGFGALIGVANDQPLAARVELRVIVLIGLVVLVAALLPVVLARYGLVERALWGWASAGFLTAIWVSIIAQLLSPDGRQWLRADLREHPLHNLLFWLFLELPIQAALVLALLSVVPAMDAAFYVSALVLNLVEGAFLLARVVMARATA